MKKYALQAVTEPVDWMQIPVAAMDTAYLNTPDTVKAWGQLALGEDALLLRLQLEVPSIRAEEKGPLGMPCEDSCLEFFFRPLEDDPRYLNFECNFNGCIFLGMGTGIPDLIRMVPDGAQELFCPETCATETGWELRFRIPHAFVRRLFPDYQPGQIAGINFYACSDLSQPAYYLSWSPVPTEPFTFHCPKAFGTLEK